MENYHSYFGLKPENRQEVIDYAQKLAEKYCLPEGAKRTLLERAGSVTLSSKTGKILESFVECLPGKKKQKEYSNASRKGLSNIRSGKIKTIGRSGLGHTSRI